MFEYFVLECPCECCVSFLVCLLHNYVDYWCQRVVHKVEVVLQLGSSLFKRFTCVLIFCFLIFVVQLIWKVCSKVFIDIKPGAGVTVLMGGKTFLVLMRLYMAKSLLVHLQDLHD